MLTHQQHRTDGPRGGPITGGQMVPSLWRKTPQGGPMPLAGDSPLAHHRRRPHLNLPRRRHRRRQRRMHRPPMRLEPTGQLPHRHIRIIPTRTTDLLEQLHLGPSSHPRRSTTHPRQTRTPARPPRGGAKSEHHNQPNWGQIRVSNPPAAAPRPALRPRDHQTAHATPGPEPTRHRPPLPNDEPRPVPGRSTPPRPSTQRSCPHPTHGQQPATRADQYPAIHPDLLHSDDSTSVPTEASWIATRARLHHRRSRTARRPRLTRRPSAGPADSARFRRP
jgi:hypothetical protein